MMAALLGCTWLAAPCQTQSKDEEMIRRIYDAALTQGKCYERLRVLSNDIGGRLSGSPEAEKAVQFCLGEMQGMQLDSAFLQPCMVPHWVRGKAEVGQILAGTKTVPVPVCALGGSIATPVGGITAEVVEVRSFEDLSDMGEAMLKGKIVFFNRPMNAKDLNTFTAYGGCVDQRSSGAIEAAKYGAVAVVVRSMNLRLDDYPHTGSMKYVDSIPKVPAAAISTNGAELLSKTLLQNPKAKFRIEMSCQTLPDAPSANVIGEMLGSVAPDSFIVIGGHLDSWDIGDGAHDDGAGCVQAMEVLQIFKAIGYQPRHTIRAVMFMNEENGTRGAQKYAEESAAHGWKHLAAIESDRGGFTPRGFTIDGDHTQVAAVQGWESLLGVYYLKDIEKGYGGVDINPLKKEGAVLLGYAPDSQRYFDYHHAATDTFDSVNKRELELGAASMAAMVYLIDKYGFPKSDGK
jgi:hypothetical protein